MGAESVPNSAEERRRTAVMALKDTLGCSQRRGGGAQGCGRRRSVDRGRSDLCSRRPQPSCGPGFARLVAIPPGVWLSSSEASPSM
jgi:hypothetical protein